MKKSKPMARSENMARVKNKKTKPEIFLRKLLWHKEFRYRLNYKELPGSPDMYLPKYTIAELQLVVLSKINRHEVVENKDKIREAFEKFLKDIDENISLRGTNNTTNVEKRYEWGKILSDILKEA